MSTDNKDNFSNRINKCIMMYSYNQKISTKQDRKKNLKKKKQSYLLIRKKF